MTKLGPPPKPQMTQWAFTAPFEGIVPHLYLDTRGHVTCGVGFLVPDIAALERYPWRPSSATARADWAEVTRMQPGLTPIHYRRVTCARLGEPDMRMLFTQKMGEFRRQISERWELNRCPEDAQIALLDMAYTLGAGGLNKYVKLRAAVLAQNWDLASMECSRIGVQRARNVATAALLLACSK